MKKQTTAGPTGHGRMRSLVAFRHQNPVARILSLLVAFAIATLLVAGTGAAYADDTAPADPTATASTPADPASSTPADPSSTPATDQPTAPGGGDTTEPAAASSTDTTTPAATTTSSPKSSTTTTVTKQLKAKVSPNAAPVDVTVPCNYASPDATTVPSGDFEIDGNLCKDGDPTAGTTDWDNVDFSSDAADYHVDGFDDTTTFTQGDSEGTNPATWHTGGPTPNGKSDIGTAYAYSQAVGGHVYGYFAFTNSSTSGGTQQYDVEYNHNNPVTNANGVAAPARSVGDLLFRFSSTGAAPLVYNNAKIYTLASDSTWSTAKNPDTGEPKCFAITGISPAAGWCDLPTTASAFNMASSSDGLFQEGVIDISAFFPVGACSGKFSTTQIRSVTGNSFDSSALKDYVYPLDVSTPSTCGSLVITKSDVNTQAAVGGAVFSITPDPRAGHTGTLCVYDGPDATKPAKPAGCDDYYADGTADGTVTILDVQPGDYTVTEIVPPPGYMLNGDSSDSWSGTVGENEEQSVSFANRRIWLPLDVSKTATGHYGSQYYWTLNKQIAPSADGPWSDTTSGSPLVKNVAQGSDTALYYRVVVNQDHMTTSTYVVDGTIHVDNPNAAAVTATIDESLPGCTIAGAADPATVSVPAGGHDYSYTCALGNGPVSAGTNKATVTWDMDTYPQATAQLTPDTNPAHYTASGTAGYSFADESAVNKTVSVEDPYAGPGSIMTITWGASESGTYTSDVYSYDPEPDAGTCSSVIQNTATLYGDDHAQLGDTSEYGKVCVGADLTAVVTDAESLTRTYPWSVQKSTSTPTLTVTDGVPTRATYDVTVTAGSGADSNWAITGTVTVTNPNAWEPVSLTGLTVGYSGSNDANTADDCTVTESLAAAVPAGGNRVFHYTCTFDAQPSYDGDVTTAITWDAAAASTPDGAVTPAATSAVATDDWAVSEVNPTVKVHDDRATGADVVIATLDWATVRALEGHQTVIHYTVDLTGLPAAGACNTKVNTVWVIGDDQAIHLDADENAANNQASVQVCTPAVSPPIVSPPEQQHPNVLPNTGGPDRWLLPAGLALLLAGATLLVGDRRRRHRS